MYKFYSQYNQDKLVNRLFAGKIRGVFLDIGANDGITLSNTWFFEKQRYWTGVCVEPNPEMFEQLKANRKCHLENCCISNTCGYVTFRKVSGAGNMLSGIADYFDEHHCKRIEKAVRAGSSSCEDIRVESRDINDILGKYEMANIDYCSIDTEGAEFRIIQTIDFSRVSIKVFSVENFRKKDKLVRAFLKRKGYRRVPSLLDDFYIKGFTWKQMLPFMLYTFLYRCCCKLGFRKK